MLNTSNISTTSTQLTGLTISNSPDLQSLNLAANIDYDARKNHNIITSICSMDPYSTKLVGGNSAEDYKFLPSKVLNSLEVGNTLGSQNFTKSNLSARELSNKLSSNSNLRLVFLDKTKSSQNLATQTRILYRYSIASPFTYKVSNLLTNSKKLLTTNMFATNATNKNI